MRQTTTEKEPSYLRERRSAVGNVGTQFLAGTVLVAAILVAGQFTGAIPANHELLHFIDAQTTSTIHSC